MAARRRADSRHPRVGRAARRKVRKKSLAQGVDDLVQEDAQVPAALLEAVQERDARGRVARRQRGGEAVHEVRVGEAQEVTHGIRLDHAGRRREQLVKDRLGVAHAAGGQAGDHRDGLRAPPRGRRRPGSAPACP